MVNDLRWDRCQPDLDRVEVGEHILPLVIDRPVRLIGNDQVEFSRREPELAVLVLVKINLLECLDRGDIQPLTLVILPGEDLVLCLLREKLLVPFDERLIPQCP